MHQRCYAAFLTFFFIFTSCASPSTLPVPIEISTESLPTNVRIESAFETGLYPNLFRDYLGKSDEEIQAKIDAAFSQLFYGDDATERVYYPVGSDMAYISDIANDDVRSEGMSYGMMIAVQMNKKAEFDHLWKWAKTYMYQTEGGYKGYFAWHCKTDGTQLAANPASDGEIWFVTALFFADGRWGSGEGIYNYRAEAQSILDTSLHDDDRGALATDLFDSETKQVVFVPQLGQNSQFTDPSYHMPHYYELWARWADKDNDFWADAAIAAREYLQTAVDQQTGLAPNYSYFDGTPYDDEYNGNFRYDAFRVGANVGMDYVWFAPGEWHVEQSNRLLSFFASQGMGNYKAEYLLTGEPQVGHRSSGLMATNAVAALAADRDIGEPFVQVLWDQPVPTGQYRYYDGLLILLGLLQVSGNFRIYEPGAVPEAQVFPTPKLEVDGRFTPPSGKALLLVGQDKDSVDAHFDATITGPGGVSVNIDSQMRSIDDLDYLVDKYPNSSLSVGLRLTDSLDITDKQIDDLLDTLIAYNRPVFLHLRYGSDVASDLYLAEWNRFRETLQAEGSMNIALVWEAASCEESKIAGYYPGDESVDWIGTRYQCADKAIQFAREHFKPVMITACSLGAGWDEWFRLFFQFVRDNNDVIRAIIYCHEGRSRLSDADIIKQWKTETKGSFWLKAKPDLFHQLGFER